MNLYFCSPNFMTFKFFPSSIDINCFPYSNRNHGLQKHYNILSTYGYFNKEKYSVKVNECYYTVQIMLLIIIISFPLVRYNKTNLLLEECSIIDSEVGNHITIHIRKWRNIDAGWYTLIHLLLICALFHQLTRKAAFIITILKIDISNCRDR